MVRTSPNTYQDAFSVSGCGSFQVCALLDHQLQRKLVPATIAGPTGELIS